MKARRLCLALETTGAHLGVALHDLSRPGFPCAGRFFETGKVRQTDLLFPTINRLMKRRGLKRSELALIAVDHGPGSFTGVRVGVAAGRGIAQAMGLPIVGVGALDALAWQATVDEKGSLVVAAKIPALAGEAYFAVFERSAAGRWAVRRAPVWTTEKIIHAELARLSRLKAHLVIMDGGHDEVEPPAGLMVHRLAAPDPSVLAQIAMARAGGRASAVRWSIEKVIPLYLQPSWAERARKKAKP